MSYETINDARTVAENAEGTIQIEKGKQVDNSIGDGPTMRPNEGRGGRGAFVPGDVIARRYVVEQMLGEGGMGIVYQCLDRVGGVKVAVKCLPPEVSRNAEEMEDIRANYRLVSDLHHPNIAGARTLELDESTGDYYLVMDLASGMSLKRWMKRNPQATMEAKLAILRHVAAALDYAHAKKIIHRDVKPENVMVDDKGGGVKVLDFGLAAQIRSSQSRTSAVVTSKGGTPGYKSPEQWRGKAQREPADVYSFGVMAYWMFAGELPFDGDDLSVLGHAVLTAPVGPVAGLSTHMNAALVKALAKMPEERFASCGEFMAALEGRATPQSGWPRPVAAAKGIFIAALLAALVGGAWWWLSGTGSLPVPSAPVVPEVPVAVSDPPPTNDTSLAEQEARQKEVARLTELAAAETPGLGSNLSTPAFIARFKDQPAATVAVTKDGGKIKALTSATITSRAVCDAVADAARRIDRIEGKASSAPSAAPAANPEGKMLFDPSKPEEALKVLPKGTATATALPGKGRFPVFEGKDATSKTTGYVAVGTGKTTGPHGELVIIYQFGFTAKCAPSFNPAPRMVNQPAVEMTDMEAATRTAYNAALQDALSQLR